MINDHQLIHQLLLKFKNRKKSYHEKNIEVTNTKLSEVRSYIEELKQQQHFILSSILLILQKMIANQSGKTI